MKRWICFMPVLLQVAHAMGRPNIDMIEFRPLCLPDYGVKVPVPPG